MAKRELEIPNNSYKKKIEDTNKALLENAGPLSSSDGSPKAVLKKRSVGQKLIDTFVAEDAKTVKGYLLSDVIMPALENLFLDTLHQGIDALFNKSGRNYGGGIRSKASMYHASYDNRRYGDRGRGATSSGRRHHIEEITFDTRQDAQLVKMKLCDLLEAEQLVSIAEYYEVVEDVTNLQVHGDYTDTRYGWLDLAEATVTMARGGGYVINFPSPVYIYD